MRPSGMPRRMKTAQEALRDRLFAGCLARAYRSQARDGMRLLWRAPMRVEEQGWTRIKAMERISEPIIGGKRDRGGLGRPRIPASRRPDPQNVGPNGFHFFPSRPTNARWSPTWRPNERKGFEIPADRNRHGPRNLSSAAKQNDKVPQGNIYRGVGAHFRIRRSTKSFIPSRLRCPRACYHQAECPPTNRS